MIWGNPWALLGLATVAIPVLVHLLGRRRAKLRPFPTLRFLGEARVVPARRHRVNDLPMLAVRAGIVACAAVALAQPLVAPRGRSFRIDSTVSRLVVVDTSASMQRTSGDGRTAADVAAERARAAAEDATTSRIVRADDLHHALPAAAAWLARQAGRREAVIVSDFQLGALAAGDLVVLPADAGVDLEQIEVRAQKDRVAPPILSDQATFDVRLSLTPDATSVTWTPRDATADRTNDLLVFAGPDQGREVAAALDAARASGVPAQAGTTRPAAIVFPDAPQRPDLVSRATRPDQPWMFDLANRVGAGPDIKTGAADVDGRRRLLFFLDADPGSVRTAVVMSAILRAQADTPALSELEPGVIPKDVLDGWRRETGPRADAPATPDGRSDGRWLWVVALALLAIEWWMRRRRSAEAPQAMEHARVA